MPTRPTFVASMVDTLRKSSYLFEGQRIAIATSAQTIQAALTNLEKDFRTDGLQIRMATRHDAEEIVTFRDSRFDAPGRYTPYWMYHLTTYGNSVVVCDAHQTIVGCFLEVSYADSLKTSSHVMAAVSPTVAGKRIAARMSRYISLKALQARRYVAQGTIAPNNYSSLVGMLNYASAVLTSYHDDFCGFGARFFYTIPLTVECIVQQTIEQAVLQHMIDAEKIATEKIRFVEADNIMQIKEMYANSPFRIVAALKRDGNPPLFVAVPFPQKTLEAIYPL